jgi:PAS domain S-box-containing protein
MSVDRDSISARGVVAAGAAFVALGGALLALMVRWLPELASIWFALGATLLGVAIGGGAFFAGRHWRPRSQRRTELLRETVLTHAVHRIIATDASGRVESFSRGAEQLLGYPAGDVVQRMMFSALVDPEELEARGADAIFAAARAAVEPTEGTWTLVRRDGSRVPVHVRVAALRDEAAEIAGFLCTVDDLTEQVRAEERRRELDARLTKITTQVPGAVFQFKQLPDGRRCFPYASAGFREMFGLDPAALSENSAAVWDVIHPDDIDRLANSINESARTLQHWECEYRTRLPDGTIRWLWGNATPERQPDESILWHGFVTDITERKNAEQAHEESRALLQSVFSSVDLGVFVVDVTSGGNFRFVEVNPAYERLTGLRAAEIRGRTPQELVPLIPAEMAECLRTSFRRGVESIGPVEFEEPFFVRGRLLWWVTRLTALRDAAGNVLRLVGRSLDITERKTVELRFHSLTERLQLATEVAQIGIWDLDIGQNRLVWDKRMHALFGTHAITFDGNYRTWRDRVHPDDVGRVEQELREALEGKKNFNTSYRILRSDGEQREVRSCGHVQRNPAGRPTRVVGVNWDVTAERRAQAEIVQARDRAETLNRQLEEALDRAHRLAQEAAAATVAKSEFLANMSHEIRTPLNAVIGMSSLLLGTELSKEQREFAETIRSSGDGLLSLINDILDYSKIESGRLDLERREFVLRDCVESAVDVLAARAAEKKIDLICAIDASVPAAIEGDETRLRQVLVNLLSNAVKFTARGEVLLAVAVSTAAAEQGVRLRFAVHDSGIGIPADRMDRLFKTFSQVDASTTRQFGGTGLGLAISKRIIEVMGGRIWVDSTTGKGSAFYFEIDVPVVAGGAMESRSPDLAGRRVLVVDDNATSCRMLCQQLVTWGITARGVASGAEALRVLAQGETYDLALCDLEMPEMSGAQLAAEIRRQRTPAQLPIVMLAWPGRARVPEELGIANTVFKPVKAGALFNLVLELMHGRSNARPTATLPTANLAEQHPLAILLAEDNPVNQRVASLMLQRLGYRADVVANGREAVEAVGRRNYDLILMDVQMPEMDGMQATREICAQQRPTDRPRIVAMTANASTTDRDACLEAGMNDFLTKPVRADDLLRALQQTPARKIATAA